MASCAVAMLLDVSFLMFDIQRRHRSLICQGAEVDLCYEDPGKEVDCYVTGSSRELIGVWMGDVPLSKVLKSKSVQLTGERHLCRAFPRWFTLSAVAKTPRPTTTERLSDDWPGKLERSP